MKTNKWKVGFIVISCFLLVPVGWMYFNSNRYNSTLDWIYSIPVGTNIDSVKKTTPYYVKVDWKNPEIDNNESTYYITIKWNYDCLHMSNGLIFENDKFKGRYVHK
jgi:uncharacterized Fe-S cluster-containing radical SAM superfamily protein